MNEFTATLNERVRAVTGSLTAATVDGDDYSAGLHASELEWLQALAADHGVALA